MQTKLPAILWENEVRLEGFLLLEKDQLIFQYSSPAKSGLSLIIPKSEVTSIEEFLLFGIERKGVAIISLNGRTDKFIVQNPREVRGLLNEWKDK